MFKTIFFLTLLLPVQSFASETLKVGVNSNDITPEVGTPLGGYGGPGRRLKYFLDWGNKFKLATYLNPSKGILDPIRSKAMIIQNHKRKVLFVSLDVVGVTVDFYSDLKNRLKSHNFSEIFISATHTHSGPGSLSKSFLWQVMAMDKFKKEIYAEFLDGIVNSVEVAEQNLTPATLHTTKFMVPEIHRNRRRRPGHMDSEARVLLAKNAAGQVIGGMVNYAIHGCALGEENLLFSADVPGGIERHVEKYIAANQESWPTILFINGAEGDISSSYSGVEGIETAGNIFAQKMHSGMENLRQVEPVMNYSRIDTRLDKARINLKKCGAGKKEIKIPVSEKMLPRTATVWQMKIGDIHILTFPGEPTTDIGLAAKELAKKYGSTNPWVFGLTNGHMGYFVTPNEYELGGYETCVGFHGANAGNELLKAHEEILKSKGL